MSREELISQLVTDMGFNRAEASMALDDTSGDLEKAVDKLLQGDYAPPPYTPSNGAQFQPMCTNTRAETTVREEKSFDKPGDNDLYPTMKNFLSDLTGRSKRPEYDEENPSAPPLLVDLSDDRPEGMSSSFTDIRPQWQQFDTLPPPYEKFEKDSKIKNWEQEMSITHPSESTDFVDFSASRSERCPVCFNAVVSVTGGKEGIVCHRGKIFHQACFMKKHGPQCAHCCFPLTQPDKDHELSGKYIVYKKKDYHVECYEKYAGPRCSHCFNVIIERPSGEFSGQYVIDRHKEFHIECLQKKMYSTWKAKNS